MNSYFARKYENVKVLQRNDHGNIKQKTDINIKNYCKKY